MSHRVPHDHAEAEDYVEEQQDAHDQAVCVLVRRGQASVSFDPVEVHADYSQQQAFTHDQMEIPDGRPEWQSPAHPVHRKHLKQTQNTQRNIRRGREAHKHKSKENLPREHLPVKEILVVVRHPKIIEKNLQPYLLRPPPLLQFLVVHNRIPHFIHRVQQHPKNTKRRDEVTRQLSPSLHQPLAVLPIQHRCKTHLKVHKMS